MGVITEPVTFSSFGTRAGRALRCGVVVGGCTWLIVQMARHLDAFIGIYLGITALGLCIALYGLVRSLHIGITLSEEGVVVRTTFATRTFSWDVIRSARTLDRVSRGGTLGLFGGPVRQNDYPPVQTLPTITLTNGDVVRFYALRLTVRSEHEGSWVDEAMVEITREAQERHGGADLGPRSPRPS